MTFGSLFSGFGMIDLGLCQAGMECRWQCEIDPFACKVLEKHWAGKKRYGDITKVNWYEAEQTDVVCGGFPCQDISNSGSKKGLAGNKSGLWAEFARCISCVRPKYVIVENVAALLVRGLDTILGTLSEFGYDAEWGTVSAQALGANHVRKRLLIVAYARSQESRRLSDFIRKAILQAGQCCEDVANTCCEPEGRLSSRTTPANAMPVQCCQHVTNSERIRRQQMEQSVTGRKKSERPASQAEYGSFARGRCWWTPEPNIRRVDDGVANRVDRLRGLGNGAIPLKFYIIGRAIMEVNCPPQPAPLET